MAKNYVRDNVPLSRFGVLVAQLESIGASAAQKSLEPLLCFDILSDLISAIDEEPKESILLCQRKCEEALYSLLILGARRPVRHLASMAMVRIISKGDAISIYSRTSTLQGFLSDGKRSEPHKVAGAAQCLGEIYKQFGRRITSGLLETATIATKLFKFHEEFVRKEALNMLQNALVGCGGGASSSAYIEAFRLITRSAIVDKSFSVRIAAARCLKSFIDIGGPGLGFAELESSASYCVKALEDPVSSVRDAFAEALGSLLALGMNSETQVQPKGKGPTSSGKKLEGCLQRHLTTPFTKVTGARSRDIRVGLTFSWIFFLQAIRFKYLHPDSELQDLALQVIDMLRPDGSVDAHALACILYIIRVGVVDQMTEATQRDFLVFLGKQLESSEGTPFMKIAVLRTLSYILKALGEVPHEFKEVLDYTVIAAVSHSSELVRIEASLALRALAEVDPSCVGGLTSYGVTTLNALRENVSFEKGRKLQFELDTLHGQATVLAALVSISPKLPLGYPSRLPSSVMEVSKKMLMESSRNPIAAAVEKKAGWLLLSSSLASLPKQDLEDQAFDILSLWAAQFSGNQINEMAQNGDLSSTLQVWSAAVEALTAFIRCFMPCASVNGGVLLHPVLVYLSRVLSYISALKANELPNIKLELDVLIIKTLVAYQSLPDPTSYKSDYPYIIQLCTTPFRCASGCDESSCLRSMLDKRDAWLGPWIPGRDWFEDELRAFQGGKDGVMPCVWENEIASFPLPETISKTLVNQMLLFFGVMFASQDSGGMLSLLGVIDQCLKAGKKQPWHGSSVTNICVGLLAGLKALISSRPQTLGEEIMGLAQSILQSILAEGDISAAQRRASSECIGYIARLGSDIYTARMTRSLLADLSGTVDSYYAGSVALAVGCIHCSAGGMALSILVPATVHSISALAKSSITSLQIWSLHGLLLTIEAAGLSYVSHVQATLGLAMDILLSDDNGFLDLQQGVGRLINAIVAVLGPELAPGSIFFSRCKSAIAEISGWQETATMLESARFTQQLVLFAPQAVSVHDHVRTLMHTLTSRQPTLRHLAVSTLRHLIEKDAESVIIEQIEDDLFHMLDEETDSEIVNLIRSTIMRLLYASCPSCPSHWIALCHKVVLATSTRNREISYSSPQDSRDAESSLNFNDEENMVSSSHGSQGYSIETSSMIASRDMHLRYRTRVFAAECLSHVPKAVGENPAHFDLSLAKKKTRQGMLTGWLVLHLQELISLAYQISTLQLEAMQPIGMGLLGSLVDKFHRVGDPELPGHLLLEQYQAQLVSAVRTTLDSTSNPRLLEAGLHLATKILTSGIISGDQAVVKRIFQLISRPLDNFGDLYYPSFAEWVSSKIKIRLLAAHASLKCYIYAILRKQQEQVPDEYLQLLPFFSKSSSILGKYWIRTLKDYVYTCLGLWPKSKWNLFLDGLQSTFASTELLPCLQESWPVILQAVVLDAIPQDVEAKQSPNALSNGSISGYSMVELVLEDYQFLWGVSVLLLFHTKIPHLVKPIILLDCTDNIHGEESPIQEANLSGLEYFETALPVFHFLSTEKFFGVGFVSVDLCKELLQVLSYCTVTNKSWNDLAISILLQVVQNCPEEFLDNDNFVQQAIELCLAYICRVLKSANSSDQQNFDAVCTLFQTARTLVNRMGTKMHNQLKSVLLAFALVGFKSIKSASTDLCFSEVIEFVNCTTSELRRVLHDESKAINDLHLVKILGTCLNVIANLTRDCIEGFHKLENKRSSHHRLLQLKLAFSLEQIVSVANMIVEIEHSDDEIEDSDAFCLDALRCCTRCIQFVLSSSNLQVQAIGLQVLKNMFQKDTNVKDHSFSMFLAVELIMDIFVMIQNKLKNPMSKESVTSVSEFLRFMVLLHTLSKSSESQSGTMNMLLEAFVFVFLATNDQRSQEVKELRSNAIMLVSRLAQIPSSALHFKNSLSSMSPVHRQQIQEVIRASVTQDNQVNYMKPVLQPILEVKIAKPAEQQPSATMVETCEKDVEGDEADEDDWDAFQSFAATSVDDDPKTQSATDAPILAESSADAIAAGSSEYQEHSTCKEVSEVAVENEETLDSNMPAEVLGTDDSKQMENLDLHGSDNAAKYNFDEHEVGKEAISNHGADGGISSSTSYEQESPDLGKVEHQETVDPSNEAQESDSNLMIERDSPEQLSTNLGDQVEEVVSTPKRKQHSPDQLAGRVEHDEEVDEALDLQK